MERATKKQIIRRSEQEKLQLIEQWEQSGLSIKTFCQQHQFSDSLLHTWLNKYRRGRKAIQQQNEFIALHLPAPASLKEQPPAPYAEVVLISGNRITLYQPVDIDVLRGLLSY